ncbi:AMP-binding protein [Actinomycetaceae bacterium WB03_NA08]|uniref:AMP-binding protein n=1 Tax=Scrofimicrobium canadense TaxID=2652290 RepID=A0A6N7VPA5_9ACTO|nr:AMP-binding protein [Scrofimicrobium canadense]MSS83537.1 AMP-binding protein [Scrofimicrobium canadense]
MSIVGQAHKKYEPGVPFEVPVANTSLFSLLSEAAHFYPSRVALDYFGAEITYSEVLTQAKKAAGLLVSAGVKPGDAVAIVLPNCPQAFVAFYACMRIGAVAAQHNPLAPAAELKAQFARHKAKVAIVWEKSAAECPLDGSTGLENVFTVDISAGFPRTQRLLLSLPVKVAREKRGQLRSATPPGTRSWDREVSAATALADSFPLPQPTDRAVILHTGGTNGVPKSVPLTHRNIGTNVNQCMFWVFELHEGAEVFFSLLPYFHAFGLTFFLCAAVKKAATQVVLPKFDAEMALAAHRRRNVTFFVGVPPMFERVAKEALRCGTDISSIRYSVSGAMPLSKAVANLWQRTTGQLIIEGYGMSETSPVLCGAPLSAQRRLGTLGLPFPSTQIRLADLEDPSKDVEDGQPGEILVKGPQVFEGYLDAPDETARVFTEDGWFRTGDIGVNHEGYIDLADRKKELIISGGFNVYPSQVEDVIRMMPGIADVAVVGTPGEDENEEVTAALILEEGSPQITLDDVRAWAEETISHYALPRKIVFLSELPRNPLGKVMRRRVKEEILDPASRAFDTFMEKATGQKDHHEE